MTKIIKTYVKRGRIMLPKGTVIYLDEPTYLKYRRKGNVGEASGAAEMLLEEPVVEEPKVVKKPAIREEPVVVLEPVVEPDIEPGDPAIEEE